MILRALSFNLLPFILMAAFSLPSYSSSSVWKVTHQKQHLYLGGTVHLLAKSDYPLPPQFNTAYAHSAKLILEADTSKMQHPDFQQVMMQQAMYPAGQTIQSKLTPDTYQALKQHCISRNLDIDHLGKFKPGLLSVILTMTELNKLNITSLGVDDHFDQKAKQQKRPMGYLENLKDQLSLIANMGKGQEDNFIQYTLEETNQLEAMFNKLKSTWRLGDMKQLNDIAIVPFQQHFPDLYKALLVDRNNNWLVQIKHMLDTKEVEFILVGALHMAGEDGLIQQLRKSGYQVERLP